MNYLDDYRAYLELRRVSPHTIRYFLIYTKILLDYEPDPAKITIKTLSDLTKKRRWNTGAARLFMVSAKSFLDFCIQQGIITINPAANLKIKWAETKKKYIVLSDPEMRRLLEVADKNLSLQENLILRLFIETGARRREILNIKKKNIDLAGGKILLETTKGGKPRMVYITKKTVDLINKYISEKNGETDNLLKTRYDELGKVVKKAIQITFPLEPEKHKLTPHALRHSFVTSFIANGGNTTALKHLLGWTSLNMLKTYEHLQDDTIQGEYEKIAQRRAI
jgi:integrase